MAGRDIEDGARRLHSSVPVHLPTELQVLAALIERSKFQHRSQPFLQRMREISRLGTRVQRALEKAGPGDKQMKQLLLRFIHALLKATVSTQQIIQLEHFLPTQISVIAVYGRLFALGTSMASYHGLDLEEALEGKASVERRKPVKRGETVDLEDIMEMEVDAGPISFSTFDMGQKIQRPIIPEHQVTVPTIITTDSKKSPSPVPSSKGESSSPPPPSSPDELLPPPPPTAKPKLKLKRSIDSAESKAARDSDTTTEPKLKSKKRPTLDEKVKAKKKKRDDMDSIFGF